MSKLILNGYRSLSHLEFEVGPFTVLFGRNNAGKTNLLEAIYGVLASDEMEGDAPVRGLRDPLASLGAVYIDMEQGLAFDDAVLAMVPEWLPLSDGVLRFRNLPPGQICFAHADRGSEWWFTDVSEYFERSDADWSVYVTPMGDEDDDGAVYEIDEQSRSSDGPRPQPLFLGWEFNDVDSWVTSAMAELSAIPDRWIEARRGSYEGHRFVKGVRGWLERADDGASSESWRVRPEVNARLDQFATLATNLLPDFLDGQIRAELDVPTQWGDSPSVRVEYEERNSGQRHPLGDFGRGASRWLAIAVQIALQVMEEDWVTSALPVVAENAFSGRVLLVDEPEAHLHPSAVVSVVRWCQRMVRCGFHVIAASHHEEFLRAPSDEVTFVKVSREVESWESWGELRSQSRTRVRTVPITDTATLQELADEVGMHPAVALSLHRAVLFVEGPLDVAVLDEYAGPELDAAGVTLIPIHGTKNLEGLIDGEFTVRLGIKTAILTDNTITATISDRSNKQRKGEEKKVIKLIERFEDQGLPQPDWFGVAEEDLLFALPAEGVRSCYPDTASEFPGWLELREECRTATGAGKSDSVDWKTYAHNHYGLPIASTDGVRRVVRKLDLAAVPLPSIRTVVDQIVAWATAPATATE